MKLRRRWGTRRTADSSAALRNGNAKEHATAEAV